MDKSDTSSKDNPERDQEVEEEYEDIVIEFEGNFDLDSVKDKKIQLMGIDTEEPVLKIDSKYYKINMKSSIGTRLLFKHNEDGKLSYHSKSDKVITARRVMVKPK